MQPADTLTMDAVLQSTLTCQLQLAMEIPTRN
jgi:hypothetical protein